MVAHMDHEKPYVPPFVRRLMPTATEAEIEEASERLRGYLMLLYRIFLRKEAEQQQRDSQQSAPDARFGNDGGSPSLL